MPDGAWMVGSDQDRPPSEFASFALSAPDCRSDCPMHGFDRFECEFVRNDSSFLVGRSVSWLDAARLPCV